MTGDTLAGRVSGLQKAVDAGKATEAVIQDYDFRVTPTCPPSTAVNIRAGKAWRNAAYWAVIAYNVEKAGETLDIATSDNIGRYTGSAVRFILTFANPDYYKPLCLGLNYDWVFYEQGRTDDYWHGKSGYKWYNIAPIDECATAQEAEAVVDRLLNGAYPSTYYYHIYDYRYFAIWSIILRNDGQVNTKGAILPIDRINRGGSYVYRDLRPGKNWITA